MRQLPAPASLGTKEDGSARHLSRAAVALGGGPKEEECKQFGEEKGCCGPLVGYSTGLSCLLQELLQTGETLNCSKTYNFLSSRMMPLGGDSMPDLRRQAILRMQRHLICKFTLQLCV